MLRTGAADADRRHGAVLLALVGLLAGGLFWIRYASVFVPGAITLYLDGDAEESLCCVSKPLVV